MQFLRYTRRMPILALLPVLATCESPSGPPLEFPPVQEVGDVVLPASLEAASDSVFELYRVRAFPQPTTHELIVALKDDADWADAWRMGGRLTGNPAVDTLITEYDLSLRSYHRWSSYDAAVLRSEAPLYIPALAELFARIDGVRYAEPNGFGGDSDDIRATVLTHGWQLDFSVGYGDCPAGCIHRHTWSFEVESSGRVTFLGASGDPAPEPGSH